MSLAEHKASLGTLAVIVSIAGSLLATGYTANKFLATEFADRIGPIAADAAAARASLQRIETQLEIIQGREAVRSWARMDSDKDPLSKLALQERVVSAYDALIANASLPADAVSEVKRRKF